MNGPTDDEAPATTAPGGVHTEPSIAIAMVVTLGFACLGAGVQLVFLRMANPVLGHAAFPGLRRWLLLGLLLHWLLALSLFGLAPLIVRRLRRRSPAEGTLAGRYACAVLPFLAWGSVSGLVFDPDIRSFLAIAQPALNRWLAPAWLLTLVPLALAVGWLARRLAGRFRLLSDGAWRAYLVLGVGLVLLSAPGRRSGALPDIEVTTPASMPGIGQDGTRRVVLFGVDGADWRVIDDLVARGELPAFARLRAEGVTAMLGTREGPSPLIWTSIATGRTPPDHGVMGFHEFVIQRLGLRVPIHRFDPLIGVIDAVSRRREVQYTDWLAKPAWEVLSERGRRTLVVNWFFTSPVLPVNGVMVSDRVDFLLRACATRGGAQALATTGDGRTAAFYPPDLAIPDMARVCQVPQRMAPWLAGTNPPPARGPGGASRAAAWRGADPLRPMFQMQGMSLEAFLQLRQQGELDLAVYMTRIIDLVSHRFTDLVFERQKRGGTYAVKVSEADRLAAWESVLGSYRHVDEALGGLIESLDERTVLIVVSDHGWEYDGREHFDYPDGIVAIWGSGVEAGARATAPRIYDIAPTIAWLTGAPVSREGEGRVLAEVFDPAMVAALPVRTVAGYGPMPQRDATIQDEQQAKEDLERLRALGYVR